MITISRAAVSDRREFYTLKAKCFNMTCDDSDTTYYWTPISTAQCLPVRSAHFLRVLGFGLGNCRANPSEVELMSFVCVAGTRLRATVV